MSSNVRSADMKDGQVVGQARAVGGVGANKLLALVAWSIGVALTWLGMATFLPGAPWWMPVGIAVVSQGLLTVAERAIWYGRPSFVSVIALLFDVALNAGGVFPYALKVGETPTAKMLVTAFGGTRQVTPITAIIVSVVVGFLIAAAPEDLWSRKR